MADSALTKRVLADALKELMQKTPLNKISVGDITALCGINRQTFYYHFKDKYDLVGWIYSTETQEFMGRLFDSDHWADSFCDLCLYMQKNKKFYINALSAPGQNSFEDYLINSMHNLIIELIHEKSLGAQMEEETKAFIADFYTYAFVGLVLKWARNGMKENPREYIDRIKELIDSSMLRELDKYF